MPNELKPCPYCNGEYVNSPDGHYVHPFNDCDDRGRILQAGDIVWFNHRPIEEALQKENAELKSFLCLDDQLDHLLEAYGLSDEPMTEKALEIKAWMQKNVIEPKARIAELEKQIWNTAEILHIRLPFPHIIFGAIIDRNGVKK